MLIATSSLDGQSRFMPSLGKLVSTISGDLNDLVLNELLYKNLVLLKQNWDNTPSCYMAGQLVSVEVYSIEQNMAAIA